LDRIGDLPPKRANLIEEDFSAFNPSPATYLTIRPNFLSFYPLRACAFQFHKFPVVLSTFTPPLLTGSLTFFSYVCFSPVTLLPFPPFSPQTSPSNTSSYAPNPCLGLEQHQRRRLRSFLCLFHSVPFRSPLPQRHMDGIDRERPPPRLFF